MVVRKINGVEPVEGIVNLTGNDINNATTTTKGVVQVGDGLSVSEGVISSTPKEFLCASRQKK